MTGEDNPILRRCAEAIVRRGFEVPALFFLEMYKPLTTLAYNAGEVAAPLVAPFVGMDRCRDLLGLLKNRGNVELLMTLIEQRTQEIHAGH